MIFCVKQEWNSLSGEYEMSVLLKTCKDGCVFYVIQNKTNE